ncbi:hypothetical protein HK103_002142 [Boothiomyces macroporosus]|uniref:Mitochondrial carrier n=1 Tax=Boothiomyces macroporosus TaxID=261099 RepID=A0AAD5Y9M4_9FUNG|nr:hypothetical protein HK103_002142 [Boothiomyces macroporosus]
MKDKDKKEEILPPLPGPTEAPIVGIPGLLAGFARSFATNVSFVLIAMFKGTIGWWFRVPIKMFRPYAINPWAIFFELAQQEGTKLTPAFITKTIRNEGFKIVQLNVLPFLFANAIVGGVLFNVYTISGDYLKSLSPTHQCWHDFSAGAIAGCVQTLLSTPLARFHTELQKADFVKRRHDGLHKISNDVYKQIPGEKHKHLFRGMGYNCIRDTAGFSMFFGVFESLSYYGKIFNSKLWKFDRNSHNSRPTTLACADGLIVIGSGAFAGAAYQSVVYPLDKLKKEVQNVKKLTNQTSNLRIASSIVQHNGVGSFFRGIAPQLVRVMPPSALGLFVYELTSEWIQKL